MLLVSSCFSIKRQNKISKAGQPSTAYAHPPPHKTAKHNMKNIFLFSNHIKPIAQRIAFASIVIARAFVILFRWNKGIKKQYLDFSTQNIFQDSYLVIRYSFKNTLWYQFKGIKKTTKNAPLVLDTTNIDTNEITLIVHGFFSKRKYKINIVPSASINTKSFKVQPMNLQIEQSFMPELSLKQKAIEIKQKDITVKQKHIQLNHSSFKQIDFI